MGVTIVVSAILTLYALILWNASSAFQQLGHYKSNVLSVLGGSVLLGIAEIWSISKVMEVFPENKIVLVVFFAIVYASLTIWRAKIYRTIWKKIVIILLSAIAITIGILA